MGNCRISDDLKRAALRLVNHGRDSIPDILRIFGFSRSTLFRTIQRQRLTGDVAKAAAIGCRRPHTLLYADCRYLLQLARHKPTRFLNEYTSHLHQYRFLPVPMTTMHRFFIRAGLSIKRVQKLAAE
jgi:hypothetical protein